MARSFRPSDFLMERPTAVIIGAEVPSKQLLEELTAALELVQGVGWIHTEPMRGSAECIIVLESELNQLRTNAAIEQISGAVSTVLSRYQRRQLSFTATHASAIRVSIPSHVRREANLIAGQLKEREEIHWAFVAETISGQPSIIAVPAAKLKGRELTELGTMIRAQIIDALERD